MARQLILTVITLCLLFAAFSQTKVENRIEFDELDKYNELSVRSFSKHGALLLYKSIKPTKSQFLWKINHYSVNLELIKTHEFTIHSKYRLIKIIQNETNSFFYFENNKLEYQVFKLNLETQKLEKAIGRKPKRITNRDFLIHSNNLIIYYSSTHEHLCKIVNLDSKKDIDIPVHLDNYNGSQINLGSLSNEQAANEFFFVLDSKNDKNRVLISYHYDINGNFLKNFELSVLSNKYLHSPIIKKLGDGSYLFIGKYSSNAYNTTSDNGIYHANLSDSKILFYTQTPLQDLQLFAQELRHHKMGDYYANGATDRLDFSVHEIITTEQGFFLTCEFYYSVYESNLGLGMLFGMVGIVASYKLTGFEYVGAEMIGFNWSGEKIWDVPLDLKLNKRPEKRKYEVDVEHDSNRFVVKHPHKSTLRTIILNENGEVLSQEETILEEPLELEFWYDKYYISSGKYYIYTVHNEQSIEDRVTTKREAFFIEKLIRE